MKRWIKETVAQLKHNILGVFVAGSHQRWLGVSLSLATVILGYLIYLATLVAPEIAIVEERFANLPTSLATGGLPFFHERKSKLRRDVKRTLQSNKSQRAQLVANSISLYLFPDLLSDKNFEKNVAVDHWGPLQEAIEGQPGSYRSRLWFEEMKTQIWNFENPDKENPELSTTAGTVLKIYDLMSRQRR